ncbi:MAG: helix-turn-helix transcriptional regulator [Methyloceanibacter sp.]|uniref:helix-turn-helix transcriptional regulator n=1 Tax=Methyloceanibacter sp. TaxID=1965321 RepID=UPI003D6CA838
MARLRTDTTVELGHFSEVISTICDCAVDPHCWPTAIEQMGELVGGLNGVIMVIDTVENESRFYADWNVDRALMQAYSEKYHAENPLDEGFRRFGVGEPYNVPMVIEPSAWLETRMYCELGEPNDWFDSLGVTLLKTPSRLVTYRLARHRDVGFAGPRELEIMRLLAPHLRKSISIAELIEMRQLTAKTFEESFEALRVPVILVDDRAGIVHANGAAQDLFARGAPIRSERGTLKSPAADASMRLEAAIADSAGPANQGEPLGQVIYLPTANGRPAFAHVLPLRSGTARGRIEPRAVAAVFITLASDPSTLPLQAWAAAFGLTQAEVRVLELLIEGHSILDVATKLDVAPTTARTHLARLMEKTGVTRQSELIRLTTQLLSPLRRPAG